MAARPLGPVPPVGKGDDAGHDGRGFCVAGRGRRRRQAASPQKPEGKKHGFHDQGAERDVARNGDRQHKGQDAEQEDADVQKGAEDSGGGRDPLAAAKTEVKGIVMAEDHAEAAVEHQHQRFFGHPGAKVQADQHAQKKGFAEVA